MVMGIPSLVLLTSEGKEAFVVRFGTHSSCNGFLGMYMG